MKINFRVLASISDRIINSKLIENDIDVKQFQMATSTTLHILPFGQHKGTPLEHTPFGYMYWLSGGNQKIRNCQSWQRIRSFWPDYTQLARNLVKVQYPSNEKKPSMSQNSKTPTRRCRRCDKKLVPIGQSRKNRAAHQDWDTRRYHKRCWKQGHSVQNRP